ncbi:TIR domain-containing protein [Nonomuraea glycinis]|uniref:TIR domain-containing protein n=1 Tax=Nonomuraea glycinis TaxID=2047744 RepID=UPI001CDA3D8E|nr:TIR domain-containing protein [Nonomuraea glycinis]MCA2174666.1 TIR domain-containing protein [Nonomuraea glycinis]
MFISHAHHDAEWAEGLAGELAVHGVKVFLDEWDILPGDVVVHKVDDAVRRSRGGIAIISPASLASPRAQDEYATLATASAAGGLRFIPVLIGEVALLPSAENRVWRDFRDVIGHGYTKKVAELAAVLLDREPEPSGRVPFENLRATLPSPPRPLTEPEPHRIVIRYVRADEDYGERLAEQLRAAGLPVWTAGDLRPGDEPFWVLRQQLGHAVAVIVLMSPQSQDSADITRDIVAARERGRTVFPILLHGERNYHLAATWYVDARDGRLLGPEELNILAALHRADAAGRPLSPARALPAPATRPLRAVRMPPSLSLDRLREYLAEGRWRYADLLTTDLLLREAGRSAEGYLCEADGRKLPAGLLAGIDAVWSEHTHGRQGFAAQSGLARVRTGTYTEFLELTRACGWCDERDEVAGGYRDFAGRAGGRSGFYPTLRNPQNERYLNWYDQWTETVLAVHRRSRAWEGKG